MISVYRISQFTLQIVRNVRLKLKGNAKFVCKTIQAKAEFEKACFNPYSDRVRNNYYVLKKFIPDIFIPDTFNVSGINSPR